MDASLAVSDANKTRYSTLYTCRENCYLWFGFHLQDALSVAFMLLYSPVFVRIMQRVLIVPSQSGGVRRLNTIRNHA